MASRAKRKTTKTAESAKPEVLEAAQPDGPMPRVLFRWEDKAIFGVMVVVLILSNYAYLVGMYLADGDKVFSGLFFNDMLSYIAKMRDGYEGFWHYTNRYTTEPTKPSLLFMFYVFLGHAARWLGMSLVGAYHLSRIVGSVALMFANWRLIKCVGLSGWGALSAFVLCFSIAALPLPIPSWIVSERYLISEGHCFLTIVYFPHITISTAFLVLIMTEFQKLSRDESYVGSIIVVGLASSCMTWIHPRLLLTVGLVGWMMASFILIREKRIPWRLAFGGISFALAGGATAASIMRSYQGDPILEFWATIETLSPHIVVILFSYGLILPLAVLGARLSWKSGESGALLLVLWFFITLGLCYYPSGHQRRMFQGFDIPAALLAGFAFQWMGKLVVERFHLKRRALIVVAGLALYLCNLRMLPQVREIYEPAKRGVYPWYFSPSQLAGFTWLRDNTRREDIVLSSDKTGQAIPGFSGNRVFVGHWAETFRRSEKQDEFLKFRDAETPEEWRRKFVNENHIRYLFWSALEFAPSDKPKDLTIYEPIRDTGLWRIAYVHPSAREVKVIVFERVDSGINSSIPSSQVEEEGLHP